MFCSPQGGLHAVQVATLKGHVEIVEYFLDEEGVSPKIQMEVRNFDSETISFNCCTGFRTNPFSCEYKSTGNYEKIDRKVQC